MKPPSIHPSGCDRGPGRLVKSVGGFVLLSFFVETDAFEHHLSVWAGLHHGAEVNTRVMSLRAWLKLPKRKRLPASLQA